MDNILIIFAKAPVAGLVKTRLFPHLSFDEAAEMQRAFLTDTVDKALAVPDLEVCIAYTPDRALEVLKGLNGDKVARYLPQEGGDLGERMGRAFDSAFETGAKKAAIVGADIPTLPSSYISEAFLSLGESDVVLGPSADGGYYLIALDRPAPGLFTGVEWSGPQVFEATLQNAVSLGLRISLLPPLRDVDTIDDLRGLLGQQLPPNTGSMLRAVEDRLGSQSDWVV